MGKQLIIKLVSLWVIFSLASVGTCLGEQKFNMVIGER